MKRYVPQQTPDPSHDLERAKARFLIASVQSGPSAMVRRHPWSSTIGTFAGTFAITGIIASLVPSHSSDNENSNTDQQAASKPGKKSMIPAGMMRWLGTIGMQLVQAYITKSAVDAKSKSQEAEHTSDTPSDEAMPHAVG